MNKVKIDNRSFYGTLLTLALPVALQNLLITCASIIDTIMVTGLGNAQLAAVGVAGKWVFLLNVIYYGVGAGAGAQISQYWGAGEKVNMKRTQCSALTVCVGLGILFTLATQIMPQQMISVFNKEEEVIYYGVQYIRIVGFGAAFTAIASISSTAFRSTENVKVPMFVSGGAVLINTFLNYVLIFGHFGAPKLGVRGAAIATLTSLVLQGMAFILIGIFKKHFCITSLLELGKIPKAFIKQFITVSMPAGVNEGLWGIGTLICAAVYARQGSDNYAAFTIYDSVASIAFILFQGLAAASSVMIGKTVGLGLRDRAYALAKRIMTITPIMGAVLGVLLIIFRTPILSLFDIETATAAQTVRALIVVYGLWFGVRMINYAAVCGIFRAGGDSRFGMIMDFVGLYCFAIPTAFIVAYLIKAPFVVLVASVLIIDDGVKIPMALRHFISKKWIRQLTGKADEAND